MLPTGKAMSLAAAAEVMQDEASAMGTKEHALCYLPHCVNNMTVPLRLQSYATKPAHKPSSFFALGSPA